MKNNNFELPTGFADHVRVTTELSFSFFDRLRILFGGVAIVETRTLTQNEPGNVETTSRVWVRRRFVREQQDEATKFFVSTTSDEALCTVWLMIEHLRIESDEEKNAIHADFDSFESNSPDTRVIEFFVWWLQSKNITSEAMLAMARREFIAFCKFRAQGVAQ